MAIQKGHRFPIEVDDAFPQGLVMVGEVAPDNEFQTREERAAGRPVRQKIDEATGKRQWKATVTDPDESNAKRASYALESAAQAFEAQAQDWKMRSAGVSTEHPNNMLGPAGDPKLIRAGQNWEI